MAAKAPLSLEDLVLFPPGDAWRAGAVDPDLSPDGRTVCYAHAGALWEVDTEGGTPRRLDEGAAPRWSPAGNALAFLRGEPAQLRIRDSAGAERQLTRLPRGLSRITFQPYGTLAYAWSP